MKYNVSKSALIYLITLTCQVSNFKLHAVPLLMLDALHQEQMPCVCFALTSNGTHVNALHELGGETVYFSFVSLSM